MVKGALFASLFLAEGFLLRGPTDSSCYNPDDQGASYRGLTDTTKSGRKCKRWTEVENGPAISDDNGLGNHGYCRNPDANAHGKPYCYTVDATVETEDCNVEECAVDTRDVQAEAAEVATYVGSHDCECAAQLFGSTTTTADTSVAGAFVQKSKTRLLTPAIAKANKVTMAQIKQLCSCA